MQAFAFAYSLIPRLAGENTILSASQRLILEIYVFEACEDKVGPDGSCKIASGLHHWKSPSAVQRRMLARWMTVRRWAALRDRVDTPLLIQSAVRVGFGPVQNWHGPFRFGYGSTRLLNGPVRLWITIHVNMN